MRCCRHRILLALALSCQGCGLQNWRLWRLRRLCSVMAGGTARPAAAEGEAGHEPGTGWPGPQVAALGRGARAPWQAEQARHMVYPRCRDGGPSFPAIISSVQSKEALDRPWYGVSQTCSAGREVCDVLRRRFRGFCTVFGFSLFGRVGVYSGISQWYRVGDAGALRAEPLAPFVLRGQNQQEITTRTVIWARQLVASERPNFGECDVCARPTASRCPASTVRTPAIAR